MFILVNFHLHLCFSDSVYFVYMTFPPLQINEAS